MSEKELPIPQIWGTPDRRDSEGSEMTVVMGLYDTRATELLKNVIRDEYEGEAIEIQEKGSGTPINESSIAERVVPEGKNFIKIYGLGGDKVEKVWCKVNKLLNEVSEGSLAELLKQKIAEQGELRERFEAAIPAESYKEDIDLDQKYKEVTEFRMDRTAFLIKHIPTELLNEWSIMTGPKHLKTSVESWVDGIHITFPPKV